MRPLHSLATVAYVCLFLLGTASAQNQDFTLIAMPDVQNESQFYPQVLSAQTDWIVDSQSKLNIQGVLGLGDIVNNGSDATQWANADAAYELLDQAKIPYFLAIGNHDYDNATPANRTAEGFNDWFGPARYANQPGYLGNLNASNENFYGTLTINGKKYLILALEFVPRDATLQWAKSIVAANPDKEVILITHSFLYIDNTRVDQCDTKDMVGDNYGDLVWSKLVSQYPNFNLVLNGHLTSGNGAHRSDLGVAGNQVNQIFANYQLLTNGGDGYLRILTFHPSTDTIDVQTYSPYLDQYLTDANNQFTINWHRPATSPSKGSVAGLVRDVATCKAIAGAQVQVGGNIATTDAKGHYSLTLTAGNYTANAAAPNYNPGSTTTLVSNGYASDTNFFLTAVPTQTCTLNPASPSVTICTPVNNASVTSPVAITGGTTDTKTVSYVQLFIDGKGSTKQTGSSFNSSVSLTTGAHRLTLQAKDTGGAVFKQTINVTVGSSTGGGSCSMNPASPSVTICSPEDGSVVTSPFTITAGTTDASTVNSMQLFIDGKGSTTQHASSFNASLTLTPGPHRLTVQAKDAAGATFKQTINVTAQ